jgi:hypothetical protein
MEGNFQKIAIVWGRCSLKTCNGQTNYRLGKIDILSARQVRGLYIPPKNSNKYFRWIGEKISLTYFAKCIDVTYLLVSMQVACILYLS